MNVINLSSDSDEDDLKEKLASWVTQFNIPHVAVTSLLQLLHVFHPNLPGDARTLLSTPRVNLVVDLKGGGQYVSFGIRSGIEHQHLEYPFKSTDKLELQFNVDGLPLFKSSNTSVWPILRLVKNFDFHLHPFVVGIYCGNSKPPVMSAFL